MADILDVSSNRGVLGTAALAVLGLTSQQVSSLVITLIAASSLEIEDYGTFMLAIVFAEFATVLMYSGFFHFTIQSNYSDDVLLDTMFWTIFGIGIGAGGFLYLSAPYAARAFEADQLTQLLRLLALFQPFAAIIAWASASMTRAERLRRYFFCLTVSNLCPLLVGVALLLIWPSIYALVAYRGLKVAIGLILFFAANGKSPGLCFSKHIFKEALGFSMGLYGTRLLGFFSNFGTDLILAYVFSTSASGLYRIANRLASAAIDIVAHPLRSFAIKSFGASVRKKAKIDDDLMEFASAGFFFAGGVALTAISLGPILVGAFFHTDYWAILPAFAALCFRWAFAFGHNLIEPLFAALAKNDIGLKHHLFWTTTLLLTSILLAPLGILELSLGQTVISIGSTCSALALFRHRGVMPVRILWRRIRIASVLLLGYGLCLHVMLGTIQKSIQNLEAILIFGCITVLVLAGVTTITAFRLALFSARIFHSR